MQAETMIETTSAETKAGMRIAGEKAGHRVSAFLRPWLSAIVILGVALASPVWAHGPTIKLTHSELSPKLLNLYVGTTVHFSNTVSMPGGHNIVDEAGTLESPAMAEPGDGWHYTFEKAGTYDVFIRQHPKARATINVIAKP